MKKLEILDEFQIENLIFESKLPFEIKADFEKELKEMCRNAIKVYKEECEEQDLLLKLPCKVGDTIYRPIPKTYKNYNVMKIVKIIVEEDGIFFATDKLQSLYFNISKIGKTMFLTKEEAEQTLKK